VYLDKKRTAFPRLHFLSNDELLNILSQANNPRAVQAHLSKLFDGVHLLDFEGEGRTLDVISMQSVEGERVPLAKSMKARGAVEGNPLAL
jgi:dynein heavy chain